MKNDNTNGIIYLRYAVRPDQIKNALGMWNINLRIPFEMSTDMNVEWAISPTKNTIETSYALKIAPILITELRNIFGPATAYNGNIEDAIRFNMKGNGIFYKFKVSDQYKIFRPSFLNVAICTTTYSTILENYFLPLERATK